MQVEVYSKDNCSFCVNVKKFLDKKEIPYMVIDLTNDDERTAFYNRVGDGVRSMPQVFLNGERVGGFNEVVTDSRFRSYVS